MPERNYCLVALFISLVAVARIAHGFFTSVTGPTLPSLAYNCGVDTSDVSAVFTWKGLGSVIGAIIAGFVFPRVKSGMGKLGMVGAMLIFNGCAMAGMPFVSDLILLGVISFITTMTASFFNTGLESLVLVIWGPDESRPIIAVYHFFFTFGGFLAPFLVGLFKDADDALKKCTNREDDDQLPTSPSNQSMHGYAFEGDFFDELDTDIIPPYLIVGGFVVGAGIFTSVCALCKLTERLMQEQADMIDERAEEPVRKLWLFFIFDMIIHACAANMDTIFQSFIYTYSLCSDTFDYAPQAANDVNTVFWIAFMAGRLSGTFISVHVAPWTFIIVDCLGSIVGLSLIIGVDGSGDSNKAILYTGVVFFGYFVSCVYGCATNLCNGYTNMGNTKSNDAYYKIKDFLTSSLTISAPQWAQWSVHASPDFTWTSQSMVRFLLPGPVWSVPSLPRLLSFSFTWRVAGYAVDPTCLRHDKCFHLVNLPLTRQAANLTNRWQRKTMRSNFEIKVFYFT